MKVSFSLIDGTSAFRLELTQIERQSFFESLLSTAVLQIHDGDAHCHSHTMLLQAFLRVFSSTGSLI
jgi:hypothetical protein